jgi:hypothetical protein
MLAYFCRLILAVIRHTSDYPKSLHAVVEAAENVDLLVDLLQSFRDMPSIFCPAARLLYVILAHSHSLQEMTMKNKDQVCLYM